MAETTPATLADFTPTWLTEELRRSKSIAPNTTVTEVEHEILGEGEGFMGIIARLSLTYDGPAGPASMIAKIPTDTDRNRAAGRALGVYVREVRMYADILPSVNVPAPNIYSAIYEADGTEQKQQEQTMKADRLPFWILRWLIKREQSKSFVPPCVLLMEDLAHAEVGDQVNGGSPQRIAAGLTALARLHASTWHVADIPDVYWTKGGHQIARLIHAIYLNGRKEFLRQAAPYFSAHSVALYESLKETGVSRVMRHSTEVPQVLVHGDYRLDNMFFDSDGSVAAVIDWQLTAPGPVVIDVGYFIVSSLEADTPESVVDDLLAGYHAELVANGVGDYPFDQFVADYVDGLLIILHRMTGITDIVDLGDGRGAELLKIWFTRADARLKRVKL